MNKLATALGYAAIAILLVAVVMLFCALPTMVLWNWLMPELFGFKTIGFFQAWGLGVLCGILFKGTISVNK